MDSHDSGANSREAFVQEIRRQQVPRVRRFSIENFQLSVVSRVNLKVEAAFYKLGNFVGTYPWIVLSVVLVVLLVLIMGLSSVETATHVKNIWVERNSRLHHEGDFVSKHYSDGDAKLQMLIATDAKSTGANVLTAEHLQEFLDIHVRAKAEVSVERNGVTYSWRHLCNRAVTSIPFALPCAKFSALDCFFEGQWDYELGFLDAPPYNFTNTYSFRPSFDALEPDHLRQSVAGSCPQWHPRMIPPLEFVYGGVSTNGADEPTILGAADMQTLFYLSSPISLAKKTCGCDALTQEALDTVTAAMHTQEACYCDSPSQSEIDSANELLQEYETVWLDWMRERKDTNDFVSLDILSDRSGEDLMESASSADVSLIVAGYVGMFAFVCLSMLRFDALRSRVVTGLMGVVIVMLSVGASLGLMGYAGLQFSPAIISVLPFLALGLGVDDMFVLAQTYKKTSPLPPAQQTAECLRLTGASVTLTSVCILISFITAAATPLPEVSNFSIAAAAAVCVNYFSIVLGFLSVLTINARRVKAKRADVLCCVRVADSGMRAVGPEADSTHPTEGSAKEDALNLMVELHTTMLSHPVVKALVLVVAIILLAVACVGISRIENGLPILDVIPNDSDMAGFMKQREAFHKVDRGNLVIGINTDGEEVMVDYANELVALQQMEADMMQLPSIYQELPIQALSWIDNFMLYVAAVGEATGANYFTEKGVVPEAFPDLLNSFLEGPGATFGDSIRRNEAGEIMASRLDFYFLDAFDTEKMLNTIRDTRQVTDSTGLPVFPSSFLFDINEQYLGVKGYLTTTLAIATVCIAFVSLFFLFHPASTLIMVCVLLLIVLQTYGFLYYFDLRINGVMTLNMLVAVGISVEFTAHTSRAFMIAQGTRNERMVESLREMFVPLSLGGISTFLGVVAMGFASFPYFRLYFFTMYCVILLFNIFNGLFVLPVLLSLVGPKPIASAMGISAVGAGIAVDPAKGRRRRGSSQGAIMGNMIAAARKDSGVKRVSIESRDSRAHTKGSVDLSVATNE